MFRFLRVLSALLVVLPSLFFGSSAFAAGSDPSSQISVSKLLDGSPVNADGEYDAPNDGSPPPSPGFDTGPLNGFVRNLDSVVYQVEVTQNGGDGSDVTAVVVLDGGVSRWEVVPSECVGDGSELSDVDGDGLFETLTCNLGDALEGSKLVFEAVAVAVGGDGDVFGVSGCVDAVVNANRGGGAAVGECNSAAETTITAGFGMKVVKGRDTKSAFNGRPGPDGSPGTIFTWWIGLEYLPGSELTDATSFTFKDELEFFDNTGVPRGSLNSFIYDPNSDPCQVISSTTVYGSVSCVQPGGPGTAIEITVDGVDPKIANDKGRLFTVRLSTFVYNSEITQPNDSATVTGQNRVELVDASGSADVVSVSGLVNDAALEVSTADAGAIFTYPGTWTAYKSFTGFAGSKLYGAINAAPGDVVPTLLSVSDSRDFDTKTAVCDVIDTASFEFAGDDILFPGGTQYSVYGAVRDPDGVTESAMFTEGGANPVILSSNLGVAWSQRVYDAADYGVVVEYSDTPDADHFIGDCSDSGNNWVTDYNTFTEGAKSVTKVRVTWDRDWAKLDSVSYDPFGPDPVNFAALYSFNLKVVSDAPVGSKLANTAIAAKDLHVQDVNDPASWGLNIDLTNSFGASRDESSTSFSWSHIADFVNLVGNQLGVEKSVVSESVIDRGSEVVWGVDVTTLNGGDNKPYSLTVVDTLPKGFEYVSDNCAQIIATCETTVDGSTVTFTISDHVYGDPLGTIELTTLSSKFLAPGSHANSLELSTDAGASFIVRADGSQASTASASVVLPGAGGMYVGKVVDREVAEVDGLFGYDLGYVNTGIADRGAGVIIDVLPFVGDDQAESVKRDPGSDFSGSYVVESVTGVNGETVFWTDRDPALVNLQPCHPSNWPAGDSLGSGNALLDEVCVDGLLNATDYPEPSIKGTGETVWNADPLPVDGSVTALRVETLTLPVGSDPRFIDVVLRGVGNSEGDLYCNNFAGQFNLALDEISSDVCVKGVAGSISDRVWVDSNGDGVQDDGEKGLAGVTVNLVDPATGDIIATATTDADGLYLFDNLSSGEYTVQIDVDTVPAGALPTYDSDGGLDWSSTVTIYGPDLPPSDGSVLLDVDDDDKQDFGLVSPASIGDYVWHDKNADGVQNDGGHPIAGVTVNLINPATGEIIATTVTDDKGGYLFDGLMPGDYIVEIDPSTLPEGMEPVYDKDGGIDNSTAVSVAAGDKITDVDFGYAIPASIGDYIWVDTDGDGVQDPDESPIAGVTVNLINPATGEIIATTTTDENGLYTFEGLTAGEYTVQVDTTTLPDGLVAVYDLDGDDDSSTTVNLVSGTDITDVDFGYAEPVSVGDRVWYDKDGDGVQDDDEEGASGFTVNLINPETGEIIATTTTDEKGNYLFNNIKPGEYTIEVITDLTGTYDLDGVLDKTTTITLKSGEDFYDVDFGVIKTSEEGTTNKPDNKNTDPAPEEKTTEEKLAYTGINLLALLAAALLTIGTGTKTKNRKNKKQKQQ